MSTPSRAELNNQLRALADLWDETRKFAAVNTTGGTSNWVALEDTYVQAQEGDYQDQVLASLASLRSSLVSIRGGFASALYWHLREWGRFLDVPDEDMDSLIDALYDDFIDNAQRVQGRAFTFGTPTANGSNTGNGTIQRLTVDDQNYQLQGGIPEPWKALCVSDANSGAAQRGQERFRFRGTDRSRDGLEILGSGLEVEILARHSRDSLLLNPSFDAFGGTAAVPTSITSWSSTVTVQSSNFNFDSTNIYLPAQNASTTIYALNVRASCTLAQRLDVARRALDPNTPYYLQFAWNRAVGSFSGSATLVLGQTSASVAITNQSGYNVLRLAAGQNSWFSRLNANNLSARIRVTRNAGQLLLDDCILVPWDPVGATYYVVAPGSTPFLAGSRTLRNGDKFSWTDTATEAVVQRFVAYNSGGRYLPYSASPTISDP